MLTYISNYKTDQCLPTNSSIKLINIYLQTLVCIKKTNSVKYCLENVLLIKNMGLEYTNLHTLLKCSLFCNLYIFENADLLNSQEYGPSLAWINSYKDGTTGIWLCSCVFQTWIVWKCKLFFTWVHLDVSYAPTYVETSTYIFHPECICRFSIAVHTPQVILFACFQICYGTVGL